MLMTLMTRDGTIQDYLGDTIKTLGMCKDLHYIELFMQIKKNLKSKF